MKEFFLLLYSEKLGSGLFYAKNVRFPKKKTMNNPERTENIPGMWFHRCSPFRLIIKIKNAPSSFIHIYILRFPSVCDGFASLYW